MGDYEEEKIVEEFRFRAINKAMTMMAQKMYELECRIAHIEKRPEPLNTALKMYLSAGKGKKLPNEQTKL